VKKTTIPRHFPYQHPTFGTAKRPKAAFAWEESVYYWWWAYLKRNKEYLACCENGGAGPLSDHYKDFGDVRGKALRLGGLKTTVEPDFLPSRGLKIR